MKRHPQQSHYFGAIDSAHGDNDMVSNDAYFEEEMMFEAIGRSLEITGSKTNT